MGLCLGERAIACMSGATLDMGTCYFHFLGGICEDLTSFRLRGNRVNLIVVNALSYFIRRGVPE